MKRRKVVLLDLWKTLVTSHCREPVWNLQRAIGHRLFSPEGGPEQFEPDDEFLRFCLTTPIASPSEFLHEAARRFGATASARAIDEFEKILRGESGCVARFDDVDETLDELSRRGYELGVVSNLWPFPADKIFDASPNGLGKYFPKENRIYSFEVGHRKPEPQIFEAACRRFKRRPEDCIMVGDNLEADVVGSMKIGMNGVLIDRPEEYSPLSLPNGAVHITSLKQILPLLDEAEGD